MQNILITGANGFIGSKLLQVLQKQWPNYNCIALSSEKTTGFISICHKGWSYSIHDFQDNGVDTIDNVIHLSGYSPVNRATMNNVNAVTETIFNTEYLLEHLPNMPKRFIFVSSTSVYGEDGEISENTIPNPTTLYGMQKLYLEKMIECWGERNQVLTQILRLGTVFGPGQIKSKQMIPMMIRRAISGKPLCLTVNPETKKNFIYVDDACNMTISALKLPTNVGPINLVSGTSVSMKTVVSVIAETAKPAVPWIVSKMDSPSRTVVYKNEKACKHLAHETTTFEDGIKEEFQYFEKIL